MDRFFTPDETNLVQVNSSRTGLVPSGEKKNAAICEDGAGKSQTRLCSFGEFGDDDDNYHDDDDDDDDDDYATN